MIQAGELTLPWHDARQSDFISGLASRLFQTTEFHRAPASFWRFVVSRGSLN